MALGPEAWRSLRHAVFALLRDSATPAQQAAVRTCLVPQSEARYGLPARIGDYTDFYTSIHHARNVGRIARPDAPLTAELPVAADRLPRAGLERGRQRHAVPPAPGPGDGTRCGRRRSSAPVRRLDYELELGVFIGPGNALGSPIPLAQAEDHVFGLCLLNDWSARDIQFWEMAPLGPFLGKNFCTSISPWIVTMEALAPFRLPFTRPAGEPQPLAYLDDEANRAQGVLDIQLEVAIETATQRAQGRPASRVSATSFRHQYWTVAQMVTQHTVGGCNLHSGDLIGTGTISGPTPPEAGAIIELTQGGRAPIPVGDGEQRAFLQDGDAVLLRGWCERPGAARIGFGECRGLVLPAA
jgi:fumarylacetoacetase